MEARSLTEESDLGIGRDAFRSGEDLKRDDRTLGLYDLCKSAVNNGKLIVGNSLGLQRYCGLGYAFQFRIDFLICLICHC